jgi:pimeloyl-ACP methyl ester carboxylesterase
MRKLPTSRRLQIGVAVLLATGAVHVNAQAKAGSAPVSLVANPQGGSRASMETMQIASHGSLMNALVYVAAGAGPHPVVILLHGFPGNERNLDLAQDMRRAGWDVMYFNYRGSWGTPGQFSFSHAIEDTAAAIAYLRRPEIAKKLRIDASRIVLIGHSMGGFMAVEAAASDPSIKAFATISAADFGGNFLASLDKARKTTAIDNLGKALANEGMAPLAGCTPKGLALDVANHAPGWSFRANVDALKNRSALIVTSDDGLAAQNQTFADALIHAGDAHVTSKHLPTDHAYSDQRTELSSTVLHWLASLPH